MPKHEASNQPKGTAQNQQYQLKNNKPHQAPQAPNMSMKTNSLNQYRGHGRGQ